MTEPDTNLIDAASLSDVGRVRSVNQDACGEFASSDGARLFVLADGMGGHRGGETASRVAVGTIGEVFRASSEGPEASLHRAFEVANQRVYEQAKQDVELAGMGTTAVALLFCGGGTGWVAHAGDSRAYRLRAGRIEALTADHSLVAEFERRGIVTPEEAAVHPRLNELLRSIGAEASVQVDITPLTVEPGDCYLLCSDGLWSLVSDSEIATVVRRERPADAVRVLVDMANARGGADNVTVQVARIPGPSTQKIPALDEADAREEAAARERSLRRRRMRRVSIAVLVVATLLAASVFLLLTRGPAPEFPWIGTPAPEPLRDGQEASP
jgi:protein phosphatase